MSFRKVFMRLMMLLFAIGILVTVSGHLDVQADESGKIDIHKANSYDELMDYLDGELLISVTDIKQTGDKYDEVWEIEVDEAGWIVSNLYYNYNYYDRAGNIDSYLYKNILLTNSVEKLYKRSDVSSSKYKCKQVSRFYVTPGKYYFQFAGTLTTGDNFAGSVAFLSSKSLIDVEKIEYDKTFESATVSFKTIMNAIGQMQLLNRGFECNDHFFYSSVNQVEFYNIKGSYYSDEKKKRIDEIITDGIEIKENGTYTLLIEYMEDKYTDFPVSITFVIDKIGAEPKKIETKSVKLNKTKATLKVDATLQLQATIKPKNATDKTLTWKSSNKKVATVDKNGKVTAKKKGTCTITVISSNGKKAKCKITVKK